MDTSRKLYRSRTDRKLAGVCGGIGQYTGVDSNVIRVLFIVFTIFGGAGLLVYLALWILIPEEP